MHGRPTALGFAAADFDVSKQMAEFFAKLVPQGAEQMFRVGANTPNSFAGVPVRIINSITARPDTMRNHRGPRQNFPGLEFGFPPATRSAN